jgi:alpha-1,3-rhamnosyl/mannosyltransferase
VSAPLEVAVNLTWLTPGRVGGSEEYLVRQLSGLPVDAPVAPTLYCQHALLGAYPDLTSRFRTVAMPFRRDWRPARIAAEHSWLAARSGRADLAHHGGGTAPLIGVRPTVVTVHDLQYLAFPSYFSASRRSYLDRMMPRSINRAAVVATPTEYVRGRVIEAFGADPARVVVVPHGIPDVAAPDEVTVAEVRRRYGLGGRPFVVYPAISHPHKRHRLLVEMIGDLADDLALVLIGGEGSAESDLRRAILESGHEARIVRPGRVDPRDRDVLIAAASVLVFPSEYEGFGAPLVEAMALDTPVVCSDQAAIHEVVGDTGIVVTEASPQAWADGVRAAMDRRDELVAAGRSRRGRFTLAASGDALLAAYLRAACA